MLLAQMPFFVFVICLLVWDNLTFVTFSYDLLQPYFC